MTEEQRENKRARDHRYNTSEKGRARSRRYAYNRYWDDPLFRILKSIEDVARRNQARRRALYG